MSENWRKIIRVWLIIAGGILSFVFLPSFIVGIIKSSACSSGNCLDSPLFFIYGLLGLIGTLWFLIGYFLDRRAGDL